MFVLWLSDGFGGYNDVGLKTDVEIEIQIDKNSTQPGSTLEVYERDDNITKSELNMGDLLLIKEENSNSYWWDGISPKIIETDLSNYYTKEEIDTVIGDIEAAFDELHTYAQALVNGGNA